MAQNPLPKTVAIVAADQIVYDRSYPPPTTDYAPIIRAVAATNPDLVVICSYPLNSVGMVKAVNEIGFKPKMIGGGMVGLQSTAAKTTRRPPQWLCQLRFLAAGVPKLLSPAVSDLINTTTKILIRESDQRFVSR